MKRAKKKPEKPEKEYSLSYLRKIIPIRRKHFAAEYCRNGWNATAAHKKAYGGTNDQAAASNGSALIRNNKVKQYIAYIKEDYEMLCGVSKARQVQEYAKIAYSSIAHLHNTWVDLKEFRELKKKHPDAVDAIESTETRTKRKKTKKGFITTVFVKVKLFPKLQALQRIDKLMDYEVAEKIKHDITTKVDLSKYTDEEKALLLKMSRKNEYSN